MRRELRIKLRLPTHKRATKRGNPKARPPCLALHARQGPQEPPQAHLLLLARVVHGERSLQLGWVECEAAEEGVGSGQRDMSGLRQKHAQVAPAACHQAMEHTGAAQLRHRLSSSLEPLLLLLGTPGKAEHPHKRPPAELEGRHAAAQPHAAVPSHGPTAAVAAAWVADAA